MHINADSAELTAEERLREIASILAIGVLRVQTQRDSTSQERQESRRVSLDVAGDSSLTVPSG